MRRRFSSLLVGLVLAGFVAGGTVAPTLHRVHHAKLQQAAQQAAPQCSHGVLEGPVVEQSSAAFAMKRCPLLVRPLLSVAPPPIWQTAVLRHEALQSAVVLALRASPVKGHIVIRGPPGRS